MKKIKVAINTDWFKDCIIGKRQFVFKVIHNKGNILTMLRELRHYLNYDVAIFNIGARELFLICLLKWIQPFSHLKIISVDLILSKPKSLSGYLVAKIKSVLLKKVDHFILFMKDCTGYEKYYGINRQKIEYIPFKINTYDYVVGKLTEDRGYIFSGGVSKRDYKTFFKAVSSLPYKVMMLVPPNQAAAVHGTVINTSEVPENVTIVNNNGCQKSWVDCMAQARFVVLPIMENTISSTGVSTYIVAMALKKCVVISECPASRDVIPSGAAIIVPPNNSTLLKEAIIRVYENEELREEVACKGYQYAYSLKNDARLVDDIVKFVSKVV